MKMSTDKFAQFISLGPACHVASSMGAYGLRSWSGPFDWLVTRDLDKVLQYIENDFEGFLTLSNLEPISENAFMDKSCGFEFLHDRDRLPWDDYVKLQQCYNKKIKRFLNAEKEPCCFIRGISSLDEIKYILENEIRIRSIIKQKNPDSEIVFLISQSLNEVRNIDFPFQYFVMKNAVNPKRHLMRGWFNGEKKFLEYCAERYDARTLMNNLMFDQEAEFKYIENREQRECQQAERREQIEKRERLLLKLLEHDFVDDDFPEELIVYGAGIVGKQFYKAIRSKSKVVCFIDRQKKGSYIDGIPCVGIEEANFTENSFVVVTTVSDHEEIEKTIRERIEFAQVVFLDKLLEK